MKVNDLFLTAENVPCRLLLLTEDKGIVVNCERYQMPYPVELCRLEAMELLHEDKYKSVFPDTDLPEWMIVERDKRWELVRDLVGDSMIVDKAARNRALQEKEAESGYSRKTLLSYMWKYWVYQSKNGLLPKARNKKSREALSEDEAVFRWALNKYYYTPQKQTLPVAYKMMLYARYCDEAGCLKESYPTYYQFRYFFRQHRNAVNELISRNGIRAYQRNHRPFTGSVQEYAQNIGLYMTDATEADIYIVSTLTRKTIGRPIIYTMVDTYSRLITGVYVGLHGGSEALRLLLLNTCQDKKEYCASLGIDIDEKMWPSHCLPRKIMTDRGSEFVGEALEGLCEGFGIEIENLPAYRPDLKGPVEKLFDLLQNAYKPLLKGKGVIEPDYSERGAPDYRRQSALDLEQFTRVLIKCVLYYNSEYVLESFLRTPEMIEKDVAPRAADIWRFCEEKEGGVVDAYPEKLNFVLLPRAMGRITQRGLEVFGVYYDNPKFKSRFVEAGLKGKKQIQVAYNPSNISRVWVCENGIYHEFGLTVKQYRGRSLMELLDVKKTEQEKRKDLSVQKLQAELNLIKDIREIASEAVGSPEKGGKLGQKIKRNRKMAQLLDKTMEGTGETDILSLLREQQEESWQEESWEEE